MLIKPASAMRFLLSCCMLQRAVLCYTPENKKFKVTSRICSSPESRFLTLYDASLRDCTLGCDIRKKCNAVNYFRHLGMCELLSDGTFNEQQENVGSCVYINRNDILTNVLSDVCKNNCSDDQVCDREQGKCTVKECQPLSVENAEILGNMVAFGSRCQMRCNSSYAAVGGETGTACSQTGKWEPTLLCKQKCPPAVAPSNGQISAPNSYEGEIATYTCAAGYSLNGSETAKCQNNVTGWVGVSCLLRRGIPVWQHYKETIEFAASKCPPAEAPSNGQVSAPNSYEGETATYTCVAGYSLIGSETAKCQLGSWNPSAPPLCKTECPPAEAPSNGQVSAPNSYEGETATYTCAAGYSLIGSETAKCQLGSWNPSAPPLCKTVDCYDVLRLGGTSSGNYTVYLQSNSSLEVYCDMTTDEGGWTVFQYRYNGSVNFYKTFEEYENGFGDVHGEFWLGLKYIFEMTNQKSNEIYLQFVDSTGGIAIERFSDFYISASANYTLHVGELLQQNDTTLNRSLKRYDGQKFSATDKDQDSSLEKNCAENYHGAWWYRACTYINPNGQYVTPGQKSLYQNGRGGMTNYGWKLKESLKSTKLMFRRM